jgi:hypothetical protein
MGTNVQYFTLTVTSSDGGSNPSGMYLVEFLETAWVDNSPSNDTSSPYSRQFEVSSNEGNKTMVIKGLDMVGNWESTLEIIIIDEGSGPNVALGVGVDTITESSDYIYAPDNTTLYYGDDMGSAQSLTLNLIYTYNGSAGILHCNLSVVWFSDNPTDTSAPYTLDLTVESSDTQTGTMTVMIWTNTGQNSTDTVSVSRDITPPTGSFALFQDSQALVSNYYHTTTFYTNASTSDGGSGANSVPYSYRKDAEQWGSWTAEDDETWSASDQSNHTIYMRIRDYVGNEDTSFSDWVLVDATAPVLTSLDLNETYAPNWYDQSVSTCAQATIVWTETYVYDVDATCTLTHTDDDSPSGGQSLINFTITGESDGSYSVSIRIRDNAGNEDTTFVWSEAPIQLESGMSSKDQEFWFYFYYFRSDGIRLDWADFNTSCVVDSAHREYVEVIFRGGIFAQKFLNQTSSIRIITRDYFDTVLYNQSFALPESRDKYISLDVNTLKMVSLYDGVLNITIENPSSSTVYTELLARYEIFRWDLYATNYNITAVVFGTSSYATDNDGNTLNDYQVDLTADYVVYVDDTLTIKITWGEVFSNDTSVEFKSTYIVGWILPEVANWEIWLNGTLETTGASSYPYWTWITTTYTIDWYNFTLQVSSQKGALNSSYIRVKVDDTVSPTITYDNSTLDDGDDVEWGSSYSLAYTFSESVDYVLYRNGSSQTTGTGTSLTWTFDTTNLDNGYYYNITAKITDGGSNVVTKELIFYNSDTTSPSVTIGYSSKTIEYSATTEARVIWTVYDLHNYNASVYIDGVSVANYTLDTATEFIEVSVVMDIDTKLYKIEVFDSAGNYASDTVTIQVVPAQTDGHGEVGEEEEVSAWSLEALPPFLLPLGALAVAVVIIGAGIFLLRKRIEL